MLWNVTEALSIQWATVIQLATEVAMIPTLVFQSTANPPLLAGKSFFTLKSFSYRFETQQKYELEVAKLWKKEPIVTLDSCKLGLKPTVLCQINYGDV